MRCYQYVRLPSDKRCRGGWWGIWRELPSGPKQLVDIRFVLEASFRAEAASIAEVNSGGLRGRLLLSTIG